MWLHCFCIICAMASSVHAQFAGTNLNWGVLPAANEEGIIQLNDHCCDHRMVSHLWFLKNIISTRVR